MVYSNIHFNIRNILEYLIVAVMIYLTGSAWISTHEDAIVFRILSLFLIALCVIYELVFVKSLSSIEKAFVSFWGCFAVLILEYANYGSTIVGLSLRLIWIISFIMLLFSKKVRIESFLECFYKIVLFIAGVSLVGYILIDVLRINLPYIHVASGADLWFYRRYIGFFYVSGLYVQDLPLIGRVHRLQSLFWEPGVYAIYLSYALYYFVFIREKKKILQISLIIVSLILTMSTTGIIIGISLFAIHCLMNSPIKKFYKAALYIPFIIASFLGIYIVWMSKKINSNGDISGSYSLRKLDIIYGIKLIAQKPLLGFGYKNYSVFETAQNLGRGSSNGLITLGYTLGLGALFLVLYPFISSVLLCGKKIRFKEIVFSAIFILTNMTEPLIFLPFMIFLVVYQYRKCWLIKSERFLVRMSNNVFFV